MIRIYRYRIKHGNHLRWLDQKARAVNFIWNWCNGPQVHAIRHSQKWPSGFDLSNLAAGSGKMLGVHNQTVQAICEKYADSRKIAGNARLRFRGKKSLGWVSNGPLDRWPDLAVPRRRPAYERAWREKRTRTRHMRQGLVENRTWRPVDFSATRQIVTICFRANFWMEATD